MTSNSLQKFCMPCLDAFGLTLDSGNEESVVLEFLKKDDASIVVKARCNQDGAIQEFALKCTPVSIYRLSATTAAIEDLFADNDQGVIIPARRLTVDGKHTHITQDFLEMGKTVWSVTTFEPNQPTFDWLQSNPRWTGEHTHSAGALLAKSHVASRKITAKLLAAGCKIETSIAARVPQLLLDAFENVDSNYLARIGIEELEHKKLIAIVGKAASNIEDGTHAKALKAEEIIVHGDFQPGNVLYRGNQACGLIDWDYARLDNSLMDIAYGLIMYAGNLSSEEAVAFDTSLSSKFLQGYIDTTAAKRCARSVCMPDCDYTPSSQDASVFSNYMKLSAALIMLWSLSECGQKHQSGVTVGRRTLQLMQAL